MSCRPPYADLLPVVAEAYDVFARYARRYPLHCCDCDLCLPPEMQLRIVRSPLRDLSLGLLQQWEGSAAASRRIYSDAEHPSNEAWAHEVRAFLPRMFEVIASGDRPSGLGVETSFRTLALADWQTWPEPERDVVTRFAEAFFLARLEVLQFAWSNVGHVLDCGMRGEDAAVALLVLGIPVDRVMALWQHAPDPAAAVHLADARSSLSHDWDAGVYSHGSVWLDDPVTKTCLGAWLAGPEIGHRLEAAFFAIDGDGHASTAMREILSRALG